MIRFNWAWATVILIGVALVGLAVDQGFSDRSTHPRTYVENKAAVEKSVAEKAGSGIYDTEVVVFATGQLEAIVNANRNFPNQSVSVDDLLTNLVYLLDGSIKFPSKVDFCQRVLPYLRESYRILDQQATDTQLTTKQGELLERIKSGYTVAQEKFQNDSACSLQPSKGQQVRT